MSDVRKTVNASPTHSSHAGGCGSRAFARTVALVFLLAGALILAVPAAASAAVLHHYQSEITEADGAPLNAPCGVNIDPASQDLYVADRADPVDVFDSSGTYRSQIVGTPASGPTGCSTAVDPADGDIYVAEGETARAGRTVLRFDPAGNYLSSIVLTGLPVHSYGDGNVSVATDTTDGDIYVAADGAGYEEPGRIYKFDSSGNFLAALSSPLLSTDWAVWPIAVDSSGDVYASDGGGDPIVEFDAAGRQVAVINGSETPTGSFGALRGLALDSTGDLYVADAGNRTVDEFGPSGTYLGRITGSDAPGGSIDPSGVAVSASGQVYVADATTKAVEIFGAPVHALTATTARASELTNSTATLDGAVDPEGEAIETCVFEWGQGSGTTYEHSLPCESPDAAELGSGTAAEPVHADISGLTTATAYHFRLVATGANGTEVGADRSFETLPAVSIKTLAPTDVTQTVATLHARLDPNGNGEVSACEVQFVTEVAFKEGGYSNLASGGTLPCSPGVPYAGPQAVSAALTGLAGGDVTYHYRVIAGDSAGTTTGADQTFTTTAVPSFGTSSAGPVSFSGATLHAKLDPEGLPTSYRFEYLTEAQFESGGFAAASSTPESRLGLDAVQSLTVHAEGGQYRLGFEGETTADLAYDAPAAAVQEALRALPAIGPSGVTVTGGPGDATGSHPYLITFEGPLAEVEVPALAVEEGSQFLQGSARVAITVAGSDHVGHPVTAQLTGLAPGTVYHYRLLAANALSPAGGTAGPEATFRTFANPSAGGGCPNEAFRGGFSAGLPDCRAYEMVTAGEAGDAEVYVPRALELAGENENGIITSFPFQVAPEGGAVAYVGDAGPHGGSGEGGRGLGDQYLATRAPGDTWKTANITAPRLSTHYQGFADNLSLGVFSSGSVANAEPPLSPDAPGSGYQVLYSRSGSAPEEDPYRPLYPEPISFTRSAPEFGSTPQAGDSAKAPIFAGASADATNLLFEVNDALLRAQSPLASELTAAVEHEVAHHEFHNYLYDSVAGRISLIDVSPQGMVVPDASFGTLPAGDPDQPEPNFGDAISTDGRRVYWTDLADGRVYLRLNPTQPQSTIEEGECTEAAKACTLPVSTGAASYWTASTNGRYAFYTESGRLYRYDVQAEEAEALTPAAGQVQGVLGGSAEGTVVYFAADGVLTEGANAAGLEPTPGQPNLYRWSGGTTTFIATLAASDGEKVEPLTGAENNITGGHGYGDWYPSLASRTSRVTGGGAGLVFMSMASLPVVGHPGGYPTEGDAEVYLYEAAASKLFCVSCDPSGAAPLGSAYLPPSHTDTYLPQWVSEDGDRVFFDSPDPLVASDDNGAQDVYEWEREGSGGPGGCTAAEAVDGGCIFLLSAATSPYDSWLIGTDAEGTEAFIVSRAQLSPEDGNEKMDLYDARVGAEPAAAEVVCEGREECRRAEPTAPSYTAPPTSSFHASGASVSGKHCKNGLVARYGKCVKKPKKHHKTKHRKKGARKHRDLPDDKTGRAGR
jgi:hypothetical protein